MKDGLQTVTFDIWIYDEHIIYNMRLMFLQKDLNVIKKLTEDFLNLCDWLKESKLGVYFSGKKSKCKKENWRG